MTQPPVSRAAGFFIAAAVIVGAVTGVIAGQPSIGVVAGFGAGVAFALLLWLNDRRLG